MQVLCVCQMLLTELGVSDSYGVGWVLGGSWEWECLQGHMGSPAGPQVLLLSHPNPTKITWIVDPVVIAGTSTDISSRAGWRSGRRHARKHTLYVRCLLLE